MERFNRERDWWSEFGQAVGPPVGERDWEEVEIYELIMARLRAAREAEEQRRAARANGQTQGSQPRGQGIRP